ncbi:helix-turn-helix domain-containing protein [Micromonospora sp. NPDC020750]|uniref:helix-turn-helix domain-containing protein n=1 Tax=unclassified Micromonospora TaxID=2617518 RepID=UPI0037A1629E
MPGNDSAGTGTLNRPTSPRLAYRLPAAGLLLDCSRRTVSNLIAAGELEVTLVGTQRRVTHESLVAYLERGKEKARAAA